MLECRFRLALCSWFVYVATSNNNKEGNKWTLLMTKHYLLTGNAHVWCTRFERSRVREAQTPDEKRNHIVHLSTYKATTDVNAS